MENEKKNHIETLELIITQYKNAPSFRKLVTATLLRGNAMEDALLELRDNFYLGTAEGSQLDIIGKVFNITRTNADDTIFRNSIYKKINFVQSGDPEAVISILKTQFGSSLGISYTPLYPAGALWELSENVDRPFMESIHAAGVAVFIVNSHNVNTILAPLKDNNFFATLDNNFLALLNQA